MKQFDRLTAFLTRLIDQEQLAGCSCVVTQGQDIVYENYLGYADREAGRKMSEDTVFRMYSMTKAPIFTAAMMLFERGLFLMDEPIANYFPEYQNVQKHVYLENGAVDVAPLEHPIQIRHALTMAMGLPYGHGVDTHLRYPTPTEDAMYRMHQELGGKGPFTLREEIRAAAKVPVAFEPGTHWMYGFGSEIAAGLVELLTGQEIEQALKTLLFEPLGMKDTGMRFFGDIPQRLSAFYAEKDGKLVRSQPMMDEKHLPGDEHLSGCPRLFSTLRDYAALGRMLACGGMYQGRSVMGRETINLMRTNQLNDAQLADYRRDRMMAGLGWGFGPRVMIDKVAGMSTAPIGEFSYAGGSGPLMTVCPEKELSMTLMYQRRSVHYEDIHLRARNVLYSCV